MVDSNVDGGRCLHYQVDINCGDGDMTSYRRGGETQKLSSNEDSPFQHVCFSPSEMRLCDASKATIFTCAPSFGLPLVIVLRPVVL